MAVLIPNGDPAHYQLLPNHLQHCPELQHCDHGTKYWAPGGLCMCFYCAVLWALRISFLPTKMSHLA